MEMKQKALGSGLKVHATRIQYFLFNLFPRRRKRALQLFTENRIVPSFSLISKVISCKTFEVAPGPRMCRNRVSASFDGVYGSVTFDEMILMLTENGLPNLFH